jgi:hypothetical protein
VKALPARLCEAGQITAWRPTPPTTPPHDWVPNHGVRQKESRNFSPVRIVEFNFQKLTFLCPSNRAASVRGDKIK